MPDRAARAETGAEGNEREVQRVRTITKELPLHALSARRGASEDGDQRRRAYSWRARPHHQAFASRASS